MAQNGADDSAAYDDGQNEESKIQSLRQKMAPHLCAAIVLVLNLAFYAKRAPTLRLVELTVCREYYTQHDPSKILPGGFVDEADCKMDSIQSKVAWLFMADQLLHYSCDFIATIPLGMLASHLGPKPIMLVNFTGLILSWAWLLIVCVFYDTFAVNWLLFGPIFCLFGGSTHFNTAIIYSEAALYSKDRTTIFSLLEGIIQIAQLAGPAIGSSLLLVGVYTPYYLILPLSILSLPLALALPSRNGSTTKVSNGELRATEGALTDPDETRSLLHADGQGEDPTISSDDAADSRPEGLFDHTRNNHRKSMTELIAIFKEEAKQFWRLMSQYRIVQYANGAALVMALGKQALHILQQYVSKRFHIKIAEAGFLLSIKAGVVLVLYVLILPTAKRMMKLPETTTTIRLARISIVLLVLGTALIGLAWNIGTLIPGLIIYAAGFGFPVLVRSLLSNAGTAQNLSLPMLFSCVALTETLGSCIGALALTTAFTKTLSLHGFIQGLPFWICAISYAAIAIPTFWCNLGVETPKV